MISPDLGEKKQGCPEPPLLPAAGRWVRPQETEAAETRRLGGEWPRGARGKEAGCRQRKMTTEGVAEDRPGQRKETKNRQAWENILSPPGRPPELLQTISGMTSRTDAAGLCHSQAARALQRQLGIYLSLSESHPVRGRSQPRTGNP